MKQDWFQDPEVQRKKLKIFRESVKTNLKNSSDSKKLTHIELSFLRDIIKKHDL